MILAPLLAGLSLLAQVAEREATPAELRRWSEALALDEPRTVLAEAREAVAPGRELARDGRAVALVARALSLEGESGLAAAAKLLDAAKPSAATRAHVELERVRLAIETDDLERALDLALPSRDALAPRWPEIAQGWLYAGRAWTRLGEIERAEPFLARFAELAPRDVEAPSALHVLAQAALARGDGAAAVRLSSRAEEIARWHLYWKARVIQVREHPEDPLPRLGLGQLWLAAGDVAEAKRVLTELTALAPSFAPGWFHLGEAERIRGDLGAALAAYSKALELEPDHLLALHNRATIHRLAGRLADARADYERIADGPRSAEPLALPAHLELARLLDAAGKTDAAAKRYARYRDLGGKESLQPGDRR